LSYDGLGGSFAALVEFACVCVRARVSRRIPSQGIIALLVNGNFKSLGFALFAGPYDDFNPDWCVRLAIPIRV
jgi:hypothetical protein